MGNFQPPQTSLLTGACFVADVEMFQYIYPYPVKATFMTDPVAQTAVQPNEPPLNVLSEPIFIDSLLIKPTRTDKQAVKALHSRTQFTVRVDLPCMRTVSASLRASGSYTAQSGATFLVLLKPTVLHEV